MRKMKLVRFLFLVVLSSCVCVGTANVARAEIYTKENMPNKPKNFDRASNATFRIEDANTDSRCTAFAVSPDGYMLTNLHCVMQCLAENDLVSRPHFNAMMGNEMNRFVVDVENYEPSRFEKAVDGVGLVVKEAYEPSLLKKAVDGVVVGSTVDVVKRELYYRITRVTEQAPKGVVCKNYYLTLESEFYDGVQYGKQSRFFYGAHIVYLGRSSETFKEEHISELTKEAIRELRDNKDDFAILKFDLPHPIDCMPVSHRDAKPGDKVWVVGYPMFAERDSGFYSPGHKKAVSFGRVRGSIAEDPVLRNLVEYFVADFEDRDPETGKRKLSPKLQLTVADWLRLETIYETPNTLLTDLDGLPGNSGSMTLNEDGRVVALLHSGVTYSADKYLGATVFGLRIGVILDEVRAGLGEKKYNEIFSCPADSSPADPQ